MRRRFYLIDNPGAGYGSRRLVGTVVAQLEAQGAMVSRGTASDPGEAQAASAVAARSGAFDAMLAAGGDGTVRLAAKAAFGTGVPVGVIPLGTGNVLAHEVGLPRHPKAIVDLLLHGNSVRVNAGRANGDLFLLMAGVGFDGRVIADLDQRLKRLVGKAAYALPTLKALAHGPDHLNVTIDGIWQHTATWVVVCNVRHYGGSFELAPHARLDTADLHVVLFRGQPRRQRLAQLWSLVRGRLSERVYVQGCGDDGDVRIIACQKVSITAPTPAPSQLDGDPYTTTPLQIEAVAGAVPLILPPGL